MIYLDKRTIIVVLTEYEMRWCENVGIDRDNSVVENGQKAGLGPNPPGDPRGHIRGAQCEFACSLGLNLFWRPNVGVLGAIDVGELAEAKSTVLPNGRMVVKPKDIARHPWDMPFVLVRQIGLTHTLLGWLEAEAIGRAPIDPRYGDPAHWIEQRQLHNIYTLKRRLHHHLAIEAEEKERMGGDEHHADRARHAAVAAEGGKHRAGG